MKTSANPHLEMLDVQLAFLEAEIARLRQRILERHQMAGLERERITREIEQVSYELQRMEDTWAGRVYTEAEQLKGRLREQLLALKSQLRASGRSELETVVQLERELAARLERYLELKQLRSSMPGK